MKLNDYTLGQYIAFMEGYDDESTEEQQIELIHKHFFGRDSISDLNYTDAQKEAVELTSLFDKVSSNIELSCSIGNQEFGFIPDLENMSFGEVVDCDAYMPNQSQHHRLMAVLYRPILEKRGDKYDIISYKGTEKFADIMLDMPLGTYLSAMRFFARLGKDLQNAFPSYSKEEKEIATD